MSVLIFAVRVKPRCKQLKEMFQAEEVSAITTGNPDWKTDDRNKSGRKTGKG